MTAAQTIREARKRSGLTQAQLGRRLAVSQAAVARLESRGSNPTIETLERVLSAAGHRLEIRAEPRPRGVDETLIAANLALTPGGRLSAFTASYRSVRGLVENSRRPRGSLA